MTELATLSQSPAAALAAPASQTVVDLHVWASELSAAITLGTALASTDFVPLSLKTLSGGRMKEPQQIAENVAATILAGKALGLDPMNSIQNIFVVHGRPAMYARTMAALVIAAGHHLERVEATEQAVTYEGRRAGSSQTQRFTWTIARAQKAGYTTNKKYQTDPIGMLTAKCQAEAARVIAPDVLTGIASTSVEEVQLGDYEDLGETPAAAPAPAAVPAGKAPVQRRQRVSAPAPKAPAPIQGPPADAEPVEDDVDAADPETGEIPEQVSPEPEHAEQAPAAEPEAPAEKGCTRSQQINLGNALKAAGYAEKAEMMQWVSEAVGREVTASSQLSETECKGLTARLVEGSQPPADEA